MYQFPLFPGPSAPAIQQPPPAPQPDLLFTEARLGALTLRNRVVMAAMTTGFATRSGTPSARLIAWYAARAAGGTGLVIVESALVGGALPVAPDPKRRRLRLDDDRTVASLRRLTSAIHAHGAKAAVQLQHPPLGDVRRLSRERLAEIAGAFGRAAARARSAGFDAVQIQASHRSLLADLLSASTNRRRDRYGGDTAGRAHTLCEVVRAVRQATGPKFPVIVKYSAQERRQKGIEPAEAQEIARLLVAAGADALEIIAGSSASEGPIRLSAGTGEATQADLAAAVREAVDVPVIAAGRILSGETAETVLRQKQGHFVALGRALLADPTWPAKVRHGLDLEIVPCIACMACYTPAPDGATGCPVAGEAGREHLPPLAAVARPWRIAVLGANLAGLEFARVAASRGHHVEIATAGLPLGGLLGLRSGVPGNAEYGRAFLYFGERLGELGVGTEDTLEGAFDLTVDCRPGPEARPSWAVGRGVLLAGELLGRDLHELYGIGRRVAVVGPGALAAEVALFLAGWGRRPTVIVPSPERDPFPDVHPMHAARLLERLEGYKVPIVAGTDALAWRYDPDRKSTLRVRRADRETTLGPFHSAVSGVGWSVTQRAGTRLRSGHVGNRGAYAQWPANAVAPRLPRNLPAGSTLTLGDTPYPEPLRDLVAFAHVLARRV